MARGFSLNLNEILPNIWNGSHCGTTDVQLSGATMPDSLDFDLQTTDGTGEPSKLIPPKHPPAPLIVIALLVFGVGLTIYFVFGRTSAPADQAATPPVV